MMELLLWFALAIDGAILLAAIVKWQKVTAAGKWQATIGRIVKSAAEARRVSKTRVDSMVENSEVRNFAAVTYAFNVGNAKFHGNRVSFGADMGNAGIAETLKRYPKGAEVTVYYDPANPSNCVLDRDPPSRLFFAKMIGGGLAAGAVIVTLLLAANGTLSAGLLALPPLRWTPTTVFAFCLALGALVLVNAAARLRRMRRRWLTTSGTVVSSEAAKLAAHTQWLNPRNYFKGRTVYEYVVDGVRYQSDRIGFDDLAFSNSRLIAERDADRFSVGSRVEVHYDPGAPSSAVLHFGNPWFSHWCLASAALALLLLMVLLAWSGGAA